MITAGHILARPIAVEDVISYLVAALEVEMAESVVVEFGADRTTYGIMWSMRQRGLNG
jgi:hypothetical protein